MACPNHQKHTTCLNHSVSYMLFVIIFQLLGTRVMIQMKCDSWQPFFTVSQPIAHHASSTTDSNSTFIFTTTLNLTPKVVFTRERGKNSKLITTLVLTTMCFLYRIISFFPIISYHCSLHASLIYFSLISLSHIRTFTCKSIRNMNLFLTQYCESKQRFSIVIFFLCF